MNTPYIKHFDENGVLKNPIIGSYLNHFQNRRKRRQRPERFYGESKNHHLTVGESSKYLRVRQIERDENGKRKTIEHYLLQK